MSMKSSQLVRRVSAGLAVAPQSLNNATANGVAISEPWRVGGETVFQLLAGALAGTAVIIAKVQLQQRSDDAWVDYQVNGTDVKFTNLADSDDNGAWLGSVDNHAIDSDTYKAIRLEIENTAAVAALVGAGYMIHDTFGMDSASIATLDPMRNAQRNS